MINVQPTRPIPPPTDYEKGYEDGYDFQRGRSPAYQFPNNFEEYQQGFEAGRYAAERDYPNPDLPE
jgi:hypothetical protein